MRDFISRTVCSVVAQYDNDDGDGNMINSDIDDMIMVMLKKIMKAFKSITKMMNTSLRLYAKIWLDEGTSQTNTSTPSTRREC